MWLHWSVSNQLSTIIFKHFFFIMERVRKYVHLHQFLTFSFWGRIERSSALIVEYNYSAICGSNFFYIRNVSISSISLFIVSRKIFCIWFGFFSFFFFANTCAHLSWNWSRRFGGYTIKLALPNFNFIVRIIFEHEDCILFKYLKMIWIFSRKIPSC